jgi:pre-mRNA-processing factor 6
LYKFELQHGNEEQQQLVLKKCIDADPRHGQAWIKVSKDTSNTRLKTEQILKRVVASLPNLEA